MYTIGLLTAKVLNENSYANFLQEKHWTVTAVDMDKLSATENNWDAVVIEADSMPRTCTWLIELTQQINVPIYLLSTDDGTKSNVVYLQLGVEVCFSEQIGVEEFYLTLNNLLTSYYKNDHRFNQASSENNYSLKEAGLELVPENLSVIIDGNQEITLTRKEYQVMELLYNNPCKAISYEEFKEKMWAVEEDESLANYQIANVVFHLRSKIEQSTTNPRFIKTIRSKGYMLDVK